MLLHEMHPLPQSPKTEILASYHPKLVYLAEWWKQLYGESEGKRKRGFSLQV
jgi:glucose-6-phosphate isomerase